MRAKDCTNFAELRGQHDVAGERDVAAGAGGDAVDRGDDGKGQSAQLAHQRIVMLLLRGAEHDRFARLGQPVGKSCPAQKARPAPVIISARQFSSASASVERRAQRQMHRLVEGVELVRPVEGEDAIAGVLLDQDGVARS